LKKSWKSPIDKLESQNTTGSFNETNPFATLIDLMKKQYEILCECEEQGKSTPWDNQVSKISPPKPNILPFSGKTLIQERLEQKQRLREIEQRKAEETKKNMRHMTLGALISKAVSNHNVVKEKSVTARRIHTADIRTAAAPRKKRDNWSELKKSWKSPIDKLESQNTTGSFNETNPFATLMDLRKKQYEILCECEMQKKSTSWDNPLSERSPPKQNILPFSKKTLVQERLEEKQRLHEIEKRKAEETKINMRQRLREIEQRKAEETKKNMRHKTLGALISKVVSNRNLVKEESVTVQRTHIADNSTADAPRKKRVSFADENRT